MKRLHLITTYLLCIGLTSSCSEENRKEVNSSEPEYWFGRFEPTHDNITLKDHSLRGDTLILSGLKDLHLWFAYYDINSGRKLVEWQDIEKTDTIRTLSLGWGEYFYPKLKRISIEMYHATRKGSIATWRFYETTNGFLPTDYIIDGSIETSLNYKTIFIANGKTKRTPLMQKIPGIIHWYNESIFMDECLYSSDGDTIFQISSSFYNRINEKYATAYDELLWLEDYKGGYRYECGLDQVGIREGLSYYPIMVRLNFRKNQFLWYAEIGLETLPIKSKYCVKLAEKNGNLWRFDVDVTYYDGAKHPYSFEIDINTGKVTFSTKAP